LNPRTCTTSKKASTNVRFCKEEFYSSRCTVA
jgi:hypothetical protein